MYSLKSAQLKGLTPPLNRANFLSEYCAANLKMWAFPGLFFYLFFSFFLVNCRITIDKFTMVNDDRKEEGKVCNVTLHVIRKSPSLPGFKPGMPRENAIALPLVPPPHPECFVN